ncbi:hypothetical protein F5Y02DRAFT_280169 [Annulohypoxylon stygium]|nr:hypothetical protein F5Y02DRAFT_280169 [Annulohypoxylon stygium]
MLTDLLAKLDLSSSTMATPATLILLGNDGVKVTITREAARLSGLLTDLMEDLPEEQTYVPVPITHANGETLERIARWAEEVMLKKKKRQQEREEEREKRAKERKEKKEKRAARKAAREAEALEAAQDGETPADAENADAENADAEDTDAEDTDAEDTDSENTDDDGYEEGVKIETAPKQEMDMPKVVFEVIHDCGDGHHIEHLTKLQLFQMAVAVDFLDIPRLMGAFAVYFRKEITGWDEQQMREYFGIKNDLTPEEEAALKKEQEWAEVAVNDEGGNCRPVYPFEPRCE